MSPCVLQQCHLFSRLLSGAILCLLVNVRSHHHDLLATGRVLLLPAMTTAL